MQDQDQESERLQALYQLRGPDLISALIKELGQLHQQVSELQREMAVYREYQAARDRWLVIDTVQKTRLPLPKAVTIDASQSLHPRQGFYGLEYGGRGTPFSWTGPSCNFSFDVFVDRSEGADLELRAVSCINFEKQQHVKLFVNGEATPVTIAKNGHGLIVRAELPARDDDRITNLVFSVPETLKPPGSTDERVLGVAFESLSVLSKPNSATAASGKESADTVVALQRQGQTKETEHEPISRQAAAGDLAS